MADSPSTKPAPAIKRPTLLPQAEHAGKPAMPLGAHQFTLIGSRNRAHLHLLSSTISRNHACIITGKSGVYVRDLASRNGVIVNGRKVRESELHDGDLMQVGSFKFRFQEPPGPVRLATTPRPPLAMVEMDGRALTPMDERTILIGRRPGCDITLDSPAVSNTHAVIFESDGKRYVRDLGSRTGTQVNGKTVHQQAIEIGDQIKIGSTTLRYIAADMPMPAPEESLPLDLEPDAVHEEVHAPLDLHFNESATPVGRDPAQAAELESESIPLEPVEEHPEPVSRIPVETAPHPQIEFPTAHAEETTSELPLEEQIPLPVEEELAPVEQDVTTAAPAIPEIVEDLSSDVWTPPSERTVTADLAAIEPATAQEEPIAFEPEHPATEEMPEAPAAQRTASDELAFEPSEEAIATPEQSSFVEPTPLGESQADAKTSPASEEIGAAPPEPVSAESEVRDLTDDERPIANEEISPPPGLSPIDAASTGAIAIAEPSDDTPEPTLGELEPTAEPEVSSLETTASAIEPDLAEPLPPAQPIEALGEPVAPPIEEPQSVVEAQPSPTALTEAEVAPDSAADSEAVVAPNAESESSLPEATTENIAPQQTGQPALHAPPAPLEQEQSTGETFVEEEVIQPEAEHEATVSSIEEPAATVDATEPAVEVPTEIEATIAEHSEAHEVTPPDIGEIDLSTVAFGAEITESEPTIDTTPEAATTPVPLLDLGLPTSELPAETETAPLPTDLVEPGAPGRKKRGTRSSRRKQGAPKGRGKKGESVAETLAAEGDQAITASPAAAEPAEVAAIDITTSESEAGFVTTEASDAIRPEISVRPEASPPDESSEADADKSVPTETDPEAFAESSTSRAEEPAVGVSQAIPPQQTAIEPIAEPLAIDMSPESRSDFETAAISETPSEPESASASPDSEIPVAAEAESAEPIATEFSSSTDTATISSAEAPAPSEEVVTNAETPVEVSPDMSVQSGETPAGPDEVMPHDEATSAEPPPVAETEPVVDSDFPLVDAELPPLPDEESPPAEASKFTSHIDFVDGEQGAVVSVTEPPVETIEGTDPTPESALDIEPSLPALDAETIEPESPSHPDSLLSDTAFGQIVTDFASQETGPLVEETPIAPPTEPVTKSPANDSQLAPLGDTDLPPLELGEALTFDASQEGETPAVEHPVDVVTEPLAFEQPAASDSTPPPAELELTAPVQLEPIETELEPIESALNPVEPVLELEPAPEDSSELMEPVLEDAKFDAGLEWDEPIAPVSAVEESGLEFEPLTISSPESVDPAALENISSSAPVEQIASGVSFTSTESNAGLASPDAHGPSEPRAKATPALPARPPMNPFFGMERDMGSFIGGMPLALNVSTSTQSPEVVQPASTATAPTAPTVAPPTETRPNTAESTLAAAATSGPITIDEQPQDELDLDKLFEGEEPLELFDETAEQLDKLPDSLEPITDLESTIGEPLRPEPSMAPASAPAVSLAPAAPLRSLTADPASVPSKPTTTSVSVPPFAGAARPGKGSNPFAGALGGLRPTDVFSQTAFPPMAEPTFKAQPLDILSMSTGKSSGNGLAPPPGIDSGPTLLKTDGDAFTAAPPPPRPVAPRPTAAMLVRPNEHRPWWKNIRVLLPLLVLLILAAAVVIIRFFPPKTVVHGTLQIKGIEDRTLDVYARREQINRVRKDLASPELREAATQRLINEGIQPGFVRSEQAMASLTDPSNSPFEDGRLMLIWSQEDGQDETRMRAVLQAVYLINKTAAEQTAQIRGQAAAAADKAKSLATRADAQHEELKKLADQVKAAGGAEATNLLLDPNAAVETLQQRDVDLHHALDQANTEVSHRHDQWQKAQEASQQGVINDSKVLQIRENLASLNARLTVARVSDGAQVDPGRKFDDALTTVDADLTFLGQASPNDAAFANYVSTARQAMAQIHSSLNSVNQDASRIDDLRAQLAAHREAHLRQVFAADETLKGLLEERDAQAHRFGTASDSGYSQDATRIQAVIDGLDQKIEARRQSLATTGLSSDDLQQHLEQTITQLREDQNERQTKIAATLARLDVPAAGKLPVSDEGRVTRIGQDVVDAKALYDQYATGTKTTGVDSSADVQKLQAQIAEQQAQLDAYEQRADATGPVAAARQALDAAQDAQAKAQGAYAANLDELTLARRYRDQQTQYNDSTSAHDAADRDAQAKATEAGNTPILLPPDPRNAVQLVSAPDQRVWYLAGAIGLILLLFAVPIWMSLREPAVDLPYAAVVARRDARAHEGHQEDFPLMDDDEHPALT